MKCNTNFKRRGDKAQSDDFIIINLKTIYYTHGASLTLFGEINVILLCVFISNQQVDE